MPTLIAAPANNERWPRCMERALAGIHQARLRQGPVTLAFGCVNGQVALLLDCGVADREARLLGRRP